MLRIALAQVNPTVGDFKGNAALIIEFIERARNSHADMVVFPELALSGYPPEDLLFESHFLRESRSWVDRLVPYSSGMTAIIGCPLYDAGVRNAAVVMDDGRLAFSYYKQNLPNYGVFDEKRYFEAGAEAPVFLLGSTIFGVSICEDIWTVEGSPYLQARSGAGLLVNLSASPFQCGKAEKRTDILVRTATHTGAYVAYCNLVGGQDELVFDGQSLFVDPDGQIAGRAKPFEQDLLMIDMPQVEPRQGSNGSSGAIELRRKAGSGERTAHAARTESALEVEEEIYKAILLGVRDYAEKNGFKGAVLGLSGGIDSSLTATVATDALDGQDVVGVAMPSEVSSAESVKDASTLADNLGIELLTIPITAILQAYVEQLTDSLGGRPAGVTRENLQARIRGNILMALSNNYGWLVLSTGNKSEMSVGYATLYGDMAGGLAVLKDVPKTMVYRLCRYRNSIGTRPVIPDSIIAREPSAELFLGQKDTDSLPPYAVLDPILQMYVEDEKSIEEMVEKGHRAEDVLKVVELVESNEYKRRQGPPGIKVTTRAFGKDRRMPITNRYLH